MKVKYIIAPVIFLIAAALAGLVYIESLRVNINGKGRDVYIHTGSVYENVVSMLDTALNIKHQRIFRWLADKKDYQSSVKPGRYYITPGMSYSKVINLLRSGRQKPVNLTFNNIRTINQLAGKIGGRIEADSASLVAFLSDESNYSGDGFNSRNIIGVFIPNTYQFFWNTDARSFYKRMLREYDAFWNDQRKAKANDEGLDPKQVSILASIIDDEVNLPSEKPRIAGVYLNRIKRGIPLQACPTIKFALNDFTITRVLNKDLQVDSPYNTYKNKGFPPGPLGCPSIGGLDAVLNAEKHDYLFFVAKADFSGGHNFSRTLAEHNRYAALYQKELDKRKIFR